MLTVGGALSPSRMKYIDALLEQLSSWRYTLPVRHESRLYSEYLKPFDLHPQLREHVYNVRLMVSPLWRGPGNIHVLDIECKGVLSIGV